MSDGFDTLSTEACPPDFWSNRVTGAAPFTLEDLQRGIDHFARLAGRIEPHLEIVSYEEFLHRREHGCNAYEYWMVCRPATPNKAPERDNEVTSNG